MGFTNPFPFSVMSGPARRFLAGLCLLVLLVIWIKASWFGFLFKPHAVPQQVKGMAGIKWGASKEMVLARMKATEDNTAYTETPLRLPNDAVGSKIVFPDRKYLNKNGKLVFIFTSDERFGKGKFKVPFGPKDDCKRVFEDLRRTLASRYELDGSGKMTNQRSVPFCNALQLDLSRRQFAWKEPSYNSRIVMTLGYRSKDHVIVNFVSEDYANLSEENWFERLFSWASQ